MGFPDIRDQHVPGFGRNSCVLLRQKSPFAFNDQNTQLTIQVVGVDRKDVAALDVEIEDFKNVPSRGELYFSYPED